MQEATTKFFWLSIKFCFEKRKSETLLSLRYFLEWYFRATSILNTSIYFISNSVYWCLVTTLRQPRKALINISLKKYKRKKWGKTVFYRSSRFKILYYHHFSYYLSLYTFLTTSCSNNLSCRNSHTCFDFIFFKNK